MRTLAVIAAIASLIPAASPAQGFPASQRQTITQNVALTKLEISYGRPVAKGRELWGKLVPWEEPWHPGADRASKLTIDHDITVEGQTLKAGEYSLWLIARNGKPWTIIFSSDAGAWHRPYPGQDKDVLRVDVTPETITHVESLTIDFPSVLADDATLRISWGTTAVSMKIKAGWRSAG
jgi:hypothetical protein